MRLLVRLRADADAVYDKSYHPKLRGRIWRALEDTPIAEEHDSDEPTGLAYSNPFPWGDIVEGDEMNVLIASPREELLTYIAEDLKEDPEFNIGEMAFTVDDLSAIETDVGEPGTSGVIETATGVLVRLYDHHREEYGIEGEKGGTPTYWRPDHTVEPFFDAIEDTLQRKHDHFNPDYVNGPSDVSGDLFQGHELLKTYALPVEVTTGVEQELVLSKWRLEYEVRDDTHRQHLNLALDTGIGGRTGLGFGFVNLEERTLPGRDEPDAFA